MLALSRSFDYSIGDGMKRLSTLSFLGDHDGEWCAVCLGYGLPDDPLVAISPNSRLGGSSNKETLGAASPSAYGLPFSGLRAHCSCLDNVPAFRQIPNVVSNYLGSAHRMKSAQIDKAAKTFHDQGLYALSAALKDILLQRPVGREEPRDALQVLERKLASLAGVRDQERVSPPVSPRKYNDRPGILLHLANWYANFGVRRRAGELLRHVEDLRGRMSSKARQAIESHYRMRVAQIRRSPDAARNAIDGAIADPYMTNTARVLSGHILIPEQPNRARTYFESILAQGQDASWLYRAESLFGIACLMLRNRESLSHAYKFLATAQYIYAALGLQVTPHPELHERLRQEDLTPGVVLKYDSQTAALPRSERLGLRQAAILYSGIQAELLSSVLLLVPTGQRHPVDASYFQRRSRVLVLGPDTSDKIGTLRQIVKRLARLGYRGILAKEELEHPDETNEEKVRRLAANCRFVIVEQSVPAGQIAELKMIAPDRYVVTVLHRKGIQATWMQADYDIGYEFVHFFPYESQRMESAVDFACAWAEDRLASKEQRLRDRYPWRSD